MDSTDFLIVGGGIIGISIALELKHRFPKLSVTLIEKEKRCGYHASGRNSGVLHAGFYYTSDSLKARFTRDGNRQLTDYCLQNGLPINRCGKLVVAQNEHDHIGLDELLQRATKNNVRLDDISEAAAKEIEPKVKTYQRALFSPTTSSVDPRQIMQSLLADALRVGILINNHTAFLSKHKQTVTTTNGKLHARFLINAAGLYADRIAHQYDIAHQYRILPFKGIYLLPQHNTLTLRTHIYPVPNLNTPFLGVHFTVSTEGDIKIGPTAMPAMWREQYSGIDNFSFKEFSDILHRTSSMFINNHDNFRKLALSELQKYRVSNVVKLANELVSGLDPKSQYYRGQSGIRAQLININTMQLVKDFICLPGTHSLHVLNTVSPGFTCAFPFAKYIVNQAESQLNIEA